LPRINLTELLRVVHLNDRNQAALNRRSCWSAVLTASRAGSSLECGASIRLRWVWCKRWLSSGTAASYAMRQQRPG